jgi:hypothetical protein
MPSLGRGGLSEAQTGAVTVCDASEDEKAVQQTLARVREMAICGLYRNCAAVEQEIRNSPHYPLIRDWFKDPLFCNQIDELCSEARKKLKADSGS